MSAVDAHIAAIQNDDRREQARELDRIFRDVTGWQPYMVNNRMIGYGRYHYTYKTGHSGTALATGFAAAKNRFTIYIMPGYADFSTITARLGKHSLGKSCCYINRLSDIDTDVLAELIRAGLDDLATQWTIEPT